MFAVEEMASRYYEPQERRTETLNLKVPPSVRLKILGLVRLWTYIERYRQGIKPYDIEAVGGRGDGLPEVSMADVANRLIAVSLDGAWSEWADEDAVGDVMPISEAEWEALFQNARRRIAVLPSSKKK